MFGNRYLNLSVTGGAAESTCIVVVRPTGSAGDDGDSVVLGDNYFSGLWSPTVSKMFGVGTAAAAGCNTAIDWADGTDDTGGSQPFGCGNWLGNDTTSGNFTRCN